MDGTFDKLREQLEHQEWPDVYFFKFIVPNEPEQIARVSALFDASSDISFHPSSNGKYVSVSVKEMMLDVDSIIEKYEKASLIKGIISL